MPAAHNADMKKTPLPPTLPHRPAHRWGFFYWPVCGMILIKPSPKGEGAPKGRMRGGLPAANREWVAAADRPPIRPFHGQLPPRGKPFCKRPFALHDKVISGNLYTRPHPSPAAPPSPSKGKAFGGSADFKKSASTIWNLDITILGFKHSDVNISKQKRKKSAQ